MSIHKSLLGIAIFGLLLYPLSGTAQIEPDDPVTTEDIQQETVKTQKPGIPTDIESVLDPQNFFQQTFDFIREQPAVQDSAERITQEGAFDDANEAIGERIGVNPLDILKAFVRAIIWVLESGVAFFTQLVS